jgi:hypothetical protein
MRFEGVVFAVDPEGIVEIRGAGDSEGLTAREIAKSLGWSVKRTVVKLGELIAAGEWECCGSRRIARIDKRAGLVPVYRSKSRMN